MITELTRFLDCMEYRSSDRRPNHELGAWPQTRRRWQQEAPAAIEGFTWDWFSVEPGLALDRRAYIPVNYGFLPPFPYRVIEETEECEVFQDTKGMIRRALKTGAIGGGRMSMDQFLEFPVKTPDDFPAIVARLDPAAPERIPADLDRRIVEWKKRDFPLVLGRNCAANGFYWRAREFMGTEALSYAWYDYPGFMHEMMEFYADFIMEVSRPVLEKVQVEYFTFNEDLSMKSGPLLSPETYRTFIFPRLKRLVADQALDISMLKEIAEGNF